MSKNLKESQVIGSHSEINEKNKKYNTIDNS